MFNLSGPQFIASKTLKKRGVCVGDPKIIKIPTKQPQIFGESAPMQVHMQAALTCHGNLGTI